MITLDISCERGRNEKKEKKKKEDYSKKRGAMIKMKRKEKGVMKIVEWRKCKNMKVLITC